MRHEHSNLTDEALSMIAEHGPILAMKWLTDAVAKAEREACAKIALNTPHIDEYDNPTVAIYRAIRARNNT